MVIDCVDNEYHYSNSNDNRWKIVDKTHDVVFTTNIFWGGSGINEKGLSRKHVMEGMNKSLSE